MYIFSNILNAESQHVRRNLALSMAAGNATLWKPSPTTPLCSIAVTKIIAEVLRKNDIPGSIAGLFVGGKDAGEAIVGSDQVDMGNGFFAHSLRLAYTFLDSLFYWVRSRRATGW